LDEAIDHARSLAAEHGFSFISPYNYAHVIAGNSTIAAELAEQVPDLGFVVTPVGGGGLAAGLGLGLTVAGLDALLVGVQSER
ncbi:pyridoxal-phosphate dependent enzyme, partial [Rhizobium johnstonii]|uniref:pyridoxal-phosphate dependent enzyme n=1 Tax=Rhizobium johnstonii TaxID=3019933 RepID=UPI003F9C1543